MHRINKVQSLSNQAWSEGGAMHGWQKSEQLKGSSRPGVLHVNAWP